MSNLADLNRVVHLSERSTDYVELMCVKLLSKTPGDHLDIARSRNSSGRVIGLLEKNAVSVMATTDPGAIGVLQQLSEAFLESVGAFSAFETIFNNNGFLKVPLRTRISIITLAAAAYQTAEADYKPVSRLSLAASELPYWKTAAIVSYTVELLRAMSPGARDLIANSLRRAVGLRTDQTFIELLTGTTGAPNTGATGTDAAAFMSDLADALAFISYGATSRLYLLAPPALNRRLLTMRDSGGPIMVNGTVGTNIKVVVSDALETDAILADTSQIAAASGDITTGQSQSAALAIDDSPATPGQLVSAFQNNLVFVRSERFFGVEPLREDCFCLITGVSVTA
jgi:hypothetical protein